MSELSLADELGIVWLVPLAEYEYVRESYQFSPYRTRPLTTSPGRLVGYAILLPRARPGPWSDQFSRRYFWVAPHDRSEDPDGVYRTGAPSEAVDPLRIQPGVAGYRTERTR